MRLAFTVSMKATLRPGAGMRARNARPYEVVRRGRGPGHFGAPRSSRPTGWNPTFAYPLGRPGGNRKVPLTFTRAARPYLRQQMPQIFGQTLKRLLPPKGKGVIRKRGETSCLPSCVPAAHSREYAVMIWHMRRAEVVAQASFSCRCAAIHLLAPYDTCVQRHRILRARNARPYEMQTADGSPGSEILCL